MPDWEAPAKLNLDLRVGSRDESGLHPLRSLVQTIEWCDRLTVEAGDEDLLEITGADLDVGDDNLVWRAVRELVPGRRPPLAIELEKLIPVAAGLGGGSADAAATLAAVADLLGVEREAVERAAPRVGSDVPFALVGGTAWMEGHGEILTRLDPLEGFAVAVAVPDFELATSDVYRRWDEMDEPLGPEIAGPGLPPALRGQGELRNDLTPAAVELRPELGEWMTELARAWGRPVIMSGSGPACFAFFLDLDEAEGARSGIESTRGSRAAHLRPVAVRRIE